MASTLPISGVRFLMSDCLVHSLNGCLEVPSLLSVIMGRFMNVIRIHLFQELIAKICSTMEDLY